MNEKVPNRKAGGEARARALSPEQRKEFAARAALARWSKDIPKATHEGGIPIGSVSIPCAVLEDGTRLLTQQGFLIALGRARTAKGGQGATVDDMIPFLAAQNIQPFISSELRESTRPINFITLSGARAFGFRAEILPQVCEVYLEARDADKLHPSQLRIAAQGDMIIRGLARVGIVALIDEATGYQEVRDKLALAKILDLYLMKEGFRKLERMFPLEYYRQMFRLRGWDFSESTNARPGVIGKYTNDLVYRRIKPGIMKKLQSLNPKNETTGTRKRRHHQYFTGEVGVPELREHLSGVIFLMKASTTWEAFKHQLDLAAPKFGDTMQLPLGDAPAKAS